MSRQILSLTAPSAHESLLAVVTICAYTFVVVNYITFQEREARERKARARELKARATELGERKRDIVGDNDPSGGVYFYALVRQFFVQLSLVFS